MYLARYMLYIGWNASGGNYLSERLGIMMRWDHRRIGPPPWIRGAPDEALLSSFGSDLPA